MTFRTRLLLSLLATALIPLTLAAGFAAWSMYAAAILTGLLSAVALAWGGAAMLSRRIVSLAHTAERYAAGDLSQPSRDYAGDELGLVSRVLDDAMREIGSRVTQHTTDRARMEAVLNGMSEGVLVVTPQGRLQLVNQAARRMLHVEEPPEGRHYLEVARHPDLAAQINGALHGVAGDAVQCPVDLRREIGMPGHLQVMASFGRLLDVEHPARRLIDKLEAALRRDHEDPLGHAVEDCLHASAVGRVLRDAAANLAHRIVQDPRDQPELVARIVARRL